MVKAVALNFLLKIKAVDFVALTLNFIDVNLFQSFKSTNFKAVEKLISRTNIFPFNDFEL